MTIPESAAQGLLDPPRARTSHAVLERVGRWVAAKGWIHVLLITGVIGCVYSLAWMFMTSIKTDEELGSGEMVPAMPSFRPQSPYVRDAMESAKPDDVDPSQFAALLPKLRDLAAFAVRAGLPLDAPRTIDADRWVASASSLLVNRAVAQLPKQLWLESPDRVPQRFQEHLTPEAMKTTISDQLCRLELSSLTLRTLDGRLFKLGSSDAD